MRIKNIAKNVKGWGNSQREVKYILHKKPDKHMTFSN